MPESDKPNRPKSPTWMDQANLFYGEALSAKDKDELSRAIRDFADLSEAEQRFMLAHLLYLNLQAQATTTRLLRDLRDTADEVADLAAEGLEALGDEGDELAEDEPGEPSGRTPDAAPPQA